MLTVGANIYRYLLDIYTILDIIYFLQVGYLHGLAFVSVYSVVSGTAQRWFPPHRRGLVAAVVARYITANETRGETGNIFLGDGS